MTQSVSLDSAAPRELPPELATAAALGGEMGRLIAQYDWSSHPLGPPAAWPAAFRTLVAVTLTSRFPIILWLDDDLTVVYNDPYARILGEKHPTALGLPGREVWWDVWDVVGPMLSSVVRTGVATWSDDLRLMIASAGRLEERFFTFTYSPILIETDVRGVFCAVTETTQRVLGERRMRTLNALGAAAMDAHTTEDVVRSAVAACSGDQPDLPFAALYLGDGDEDGCPLAGATPRIADLLRHGAPTAAFWTSEQPASPRRGLVDGLVARLPALPASFDGSSPNQALVLPLPAATSEATAGQLVIGLNPHRPLDEQYEGFCRLLADQVSTALTNARSFEFQRRRAEALAELDEAKTAFLTNVSHEFRTPLALMLGPLEDAIAQARQPALARRLETVHRNGRRLLRQVNALLDFARVQAGQTRPQPRLVDVGLVTADIASSFSELCERGGIQLLLECDSALGMVDLEMWETIVLNLISNAFKFTLSGSISVRVGPAGTDAIEVAVADTGTGIAPEDVGRLFERFYRADNDRGRSVEGSGIGLALVRNLVEINGGSIEATSTRDVGTTMTIRLPRAAAHGPGAASAARAYADNPYVAEALQWLGEDLTAAGSPVEGPMPRPIILIADDNADMRRHISQVLGDRWHTIAFPDGESALTFARTHRPDLIVTDLMMPTLDGFELVAAIRAEPELAALPMIMLSARAGVEASGEGLAAGADDYLVKPFRSQDLVNRVAARLEVAARERTSRERGEQASRHATELAELDAALSAAPSLRAAVGALLTSPVGALRATTAALAVVDQTAGAVRIEYAGALDRELAHRYHLLALDAPVPIVEVIGREEAMIIPDLAALPRRFATAVRDAAPSVGAAIIHPLRGADGAVVGALSVGWPGAREFTEGEISSAEQVAPLVTRAVERIGVAEREHLIATALQERLLDLQVNSTSAVVAATYQPAGEVVRVGGDWYTATSLDGVGRIGVSVGDVVGHGLAGATVMSQLRSALGAAALTATDPAAVVDLLDRYASRVSGAACTTVAYAVLEASGSLRYMCAGHPYPLLVAPDGTTTLLQDGRRSPLSTQAPGEAAPSVSGHTSLPDGGLLLLYTDGLIERRGESLDSGLHRLAVAAAQCARLPAADVCASLLEQMAPDLGYADDVALVAVRRTASTPDSFVSAVPASAQSLGPLRHRLRDWLRAAAPTLTAETIYDILLTTGEAVVNAIEHGSDFNSTRTVSLEVFADPEEIRATVSDTGRWTSDSAQRSPGGGRGRGLTLIHGLSDDVTTVRTMLGTRVTIRHRIRPGEAPDADTPQGADRR